MIFRRFRPLRWLFSLLRQRNPVYETMTRFQYAGWTVRVWREEPEYREGPDKEVLELLKARFVWGASRSEVVHAVGKLPRIAAIEVLSGDGNGGLFYPDWR